MPPDYLAITLGLSITAGLLVVLLLMWHCTALPSIVKPRLRRKKQPQDLDRIDINEMIEAGPVNPAEDLDPNLDLNPIQALRIEQKRKAEAKAKEVARKAAKEAARTGAAGGAAGAGAAAGGRGAGRRRSCMATLGLDRFSFKRSNSGGAGGAAVGAGANPGIREVDAQIRRDVEAAKRKEADAAALAQRRAHEALERAEAAGEQAVAEPAGRKPRRATLLSDVFGKKNETTAPRKRYLAVPAAGATPSIELTSSACAEPLT